MHSFEFEIDYIRVYQSLEEEFLWQWGNGGNSQIAGWNMNQGDKFIAGDFNQDGRDEILAIAQNGWSKLLRYDGTTWQDKWHNNGNGQIAGWYMNQGDKFVAGDFDQDGRDEILAVAQNGWSKLLRYDGTTWQDKWHNNGNSQIAGWNMNQGDKFIAGDFDQDGREEILAIAQNGWSKMLRYDGTTWQDKWHNNGNGQIAGWYMNQGDKFIAGDFDQDGREEILGDCPKRLVEDVKVRRNYLAGQMAQQRQRSSSGLAYESRRQVHCRGF
ncbi:MAG: VCBS repeat-containing protein [Saprospiraceae bacterium]|nr:VCBS repeat-containing protein [Saprospiraceae bacterium]